MADFFVTIIMANWAEIIIYLLVMIVVAKLIHMVEETMAGLP